MFEQLDSCKLTDGRISAEDLRNFLTNLDYENLDLSPYRKFGDTYQRNLIVKTPLYEALLLCWKPGQRSPIHDHHGANCGLLVLEGFACENVFKQQNGLRYVQTKHFSVGKVCVSSDDEIHEVGNYHSTIDLVTLHIYTPNIDGMREYSVDDITRVMPHRLVGR